jgi:hypothetical protein
MGKEYFEIDTKEITRKIRRMEQEFSISLMGKFIKALGIMGNNMGREF